MSLEPFTFRLRGSFTFAVVGSYEKQKAKNQVSTHKVNLSGTGRPRFKSWAGPIEPVLPLARHRHDIFLKGAEFSR